MGGLLLHVKPKFMGHYFNKNLDSSLKISARALVLENLNPRSLIQSRRRMENLM
jgi:hypothetical protein